MCRGSRSQELHVWSVLFAEQFRHEEVDLDAPTRQRSREAFAGRSEAAANVGRVLPAKHEYFHGLAILATRSTSATLHACAGVPPGR